LPNAKGRPGAAGGVSTPILDRRVGVDSDAVVLTDDEIRALIDDYVAAARIAREAGYDFVDVKHCHGYLGHELLAGHTRPGRFGGNFENRTRFLREIVGGVRAAAPGLKVGGAFRRSTSSRTAPTPRGRRRQARPRRPGAVRAPVALPVGVRREPGNPLEPDLAENGRIPPPARAARRPAGKPVGGKSLLQPPRPAAAYYPPSDGYQPPEDPLVGVARQMDAVRKLKALFPKMLIVGSGYSYLRNSSRTSRRAAVRMGLVDCIGLGRVVLSYPEILDDAVRGRPAQTKRSAARSATAPRPPATACRRACYPLDDYYRAPSFTRG
jgi:hypothetical protein